MSTIGFIGTGRISAAMIDGLAKTVGHTDQVWISPRNAILAKALKTRHAHVEIAKDNQEIIDHCETIVISVRPQIVSEVLSELCFKPNQIVISLVATLSIEQLKELIKVPVALNRAVPLPFVENQRDTTLVYPKATPHCRDLFNRLGQIIEIEDINLLNVFTVASAMMGTYFSLLDNLSLWMQEKGVEEGDAKLYLSNLFNELGHIAKQPTSFAHLQDEYSTPGGLNERMAKSFLNADTQSHLFGALNQLLATVTNNALANTKK
ncbi:NAD(P)-binding domain-containing protein [Leeia sp. TBRC 13508]|uniref:NAD(P)-binding domain-containing protein n=1 Tax=Leeia speluncae TaxID=2884804 RepID=A0ABS8DAH6_9NEIS|nr:pyrroline-5-carboxylate reductase [Leeia speluncae]MCB6185008.1 NAD(P)-binding domain-containing protein [Leeia speluncae]